MGITKTGYENIINFMIKGNKDKQCDEELLLDGNKFNSKLKAIKKARKQEIATLINKIKTKATSIKPTTNINEAIYNGKGYAINDNDNEFYVKILNGHPLHDIIKMEFWGEQKGKQYFIDCLLDPGATISTCNEYGFEILKQYAVKRKNGFQVFGFNNKPSVISSYIHVWLINRDNLVGKHPTLAQTRFHLVKGSRYTFLLGNKELRELGITYSTINTNNINHISLIPGKTATCPGQVSFISTTKDVTPAKTATTKGGVHVTLKQNGNMCDGMDINKNISIKPINLNTSTSEIGINTVKISDESKAKQYYHQNYANIIPNIDKYPNWNGISVIIEDDALNMIHHYKQIGKPMDILSDNAEDKNYFNNINYGTTDEDELKLGIDALTDEEFANKVIETDNGLIPHTLRDAKGNIDEDGTLKQKVVDILVKNRKAFAEKLIDITERAPEQFDAKYYPKPTFMRPPVPPLYPASEKGRKVMQIKTQELLDNKMAEPADETIEQIIPAFVVHENDDKARMVLDARICNAQTYVEQSIPFDTESLDSILSKSNILNIFDIKSGFHHINIRKKDKKYFGFRNNMGIFVMLVLFFGYINAVQQFTRYIRHVIKIFDNIVSWMDDLLSGCIDLNENVNFLDIFLKRCIKYNIRLNITKCKLFRLSTVFIGKEIHIKEGIKLAPKLVDRIKKLKPIKGWKDIEYLVNFSSFANQNVIHLAKYVKLVRMQLKLLRNKEFDKYYNGLIKIHVERLINLIINNDWIKPVKIDALKIIEVDSSDIAMGCILKQVKDSNDIEICGVWGKGFCSSNISRHITWKEAYSTVIAIEHWSRYLLQKPFILITDQSGIPDRYNLDRNTKDGRVMARLSARLAAYSFVAVHRSGIKNIGADYCSRFIEEFHNTILINSNVNSKDIYGKSKLTFKDGITTNIKDHDKLAFSTFNDTNINDKHKSDDKLFTIHLKGKFGTFKITKDHDTITLHPKHISGNNLNEYSVLLLYNKYAKASPTNNETVATFNDIKHVLILNDQNEYTIKHLPFINYKKKITNYGLNAFETPYIYAISNELGKMSYKQFKQLLAQFNAKQQKKVKDIKKYRELLKQIDKILLLNDKSLKEKYSKTLALRDDLLELIKAVQLYKPYFGIHGKQVKCESKLEKEFIQEQINAITRKSRAAKSTALARIKQQTKLLNGTSVKAAKDAGVSTFKALAKAKRSVNPAGKLKSKAVAAAKATALAKAVKAVAKSRSIDKAKGVTFAKDVKIVNGDGALDHGDLKDAEAQVDPSAEANGQRGFISLDDVPAADKLNIEFKRRVEGKQELNELQKELNDDKVIELKQNEKKDIIKQKRKKSRELQQQNIQQKKRLFRIKINRDVKNILDITKISLNELILQQEKDILINGIKNYILNDDESYLFDFDDRIIRKIIKEKDLYGITVDGIVVYKNKYMVPSKLVFSLCWYYHSNEGHVMKDLLCNKLKKYFYFNNMDMYIEELVKGCSECQQAKGKRDNKYNINIHKIYTINKCWQIDFIGPLPVDKGYKYILSGIDYFDGYVILEPLMNIKGYNVVPALIRRIILPFGVLHFKSDLGEPFISTFLEDMANIFQVQLKFTSGYRPQSTGKVERSHGTINCMILVNELINYMLNGNELEKDKLNWVHQLPFLESTLNSINYEDKQGSSPNDIRFGEGQIRNALEIQWKLKELNPNKYVNKGKIDWEKYLKLVNAIRAGSRYAAVLARKEYDNKRIKYFNKIKGLGINIKPTQYKHGEEVLVWARNGLVGNEYKYNCRWTRGYYYNYSYGNNIVLMSDSDHAKAKFTNIVTHRTNVRKYHDYMNIPDMYKNNNYTKYMNWIKTMEKHFPNLKSNNVNEFKEDPDYVPE